MNLSLFNAEYKEIFPGVPMFRSELMTLLTGKPSIDTIKLDDWAQKHDGYVMDGKTSLNDHIRSKYGDRAVDFLNKYF